MFKHELKARVIYADTDKAGVVYYANYLRYFEMGRTELLRDLGVSYNELEEQDKVVMPVVELNCRYHSSARYDDLLTIETLIEKHDKVSVTFTNRIFRQGEDKPLVEGSCKLVAVNKQGKLTRLPKKLIELLVACPE